MVIPQNQQYKKILEYIDKNVDRILLLRIRKWVKEQDIIKHMERYGISRTTTKTRLSELCKNRKLQTKSWGGMRFYAPITIPHVIIAGGITTAILAFIFKPLTGYSINLGSYMLIFTPFLLSVAIWLIEKKQKNIGICRGCGLTLYNGELYCSKCAEANKSVERTCQLCGATFVVKASDDGRYCDTCKPVVERMKGK